MRSATRFIGLVALALASGASAQTYPTKSINMIVSSAPGGPIDFAARSIKEGLETELGKPVIIENRPGAGGMTATTAAARSPADGYTLLMSGAGPMVITPLLYEKVPYDPLRDFLPINHIIDLPCYVAVNPKTKVSSIDELAALAKSANPRLTYATSGIGTPSHLAMVIFETLYGIELEHIPYKGAPEAANSVATGETNIILSTAIVATPLIEAGKLKPLVITGSRRLRADVPTIGDIKQPTLTAPLWVGLWAPKGTPTEIVDRLNQAVAKTLGDAKVKATIEKSMAIVVNNGPGEYAKLVRNELETWGKVIKDRNIKVDQ